METIYGKTANALMAKQISDVLQDEVEGTLFIGYPVLSTSEDPVFIEAMLVSHTHGLIVFLLESDTSRAERELLDKQDAVYFAVASNLMKHTSLRAGRELAIKPSILTIVPDRPAVFNAASIVTFNNVVERIKELPGIAPALIRPLNAALERISTIKPARKRTEARSPGSKGSILRVIEQEIANLDKWQKRAVIESPDGPQRIRGLAGSGKTIILALKAAYLHASNPDWKIVVTFHTRSLYQQIEDLIRRFCLEHISEEPNWEKLLVLHSWGSVNSPGMYSLMAEASGHAIRDLDYAKSVYGADHGFEGVCSELLNALKVQPAIEQFDAVLIDEAQDLPLPFFRLIYEFTNDPKRIVWAYDELQTLNSSSMPPTAQLFGENARGEANVQLSNPINGPRQDIILQTCYRNTPWALTLAHAIGFGIYNTDGIVQFFDDPDLWSEIGYQVMSGDPRPDHDVELKRKPESYPAFFEELLTKEDAVQCNIFGDTQEQTLALVQAIRKNIYEDELLADDILIILPDPRTFRSDALRLNGVMVRAEIESHVAGITSSRDTIRLPGHVCISSIYRAKGNEAAMVYVLNCQNTMNRFDTVRFRNVMFTAITRSRAWVRLFGFGPDMERFAREVALVKENDYVLRFHIPPLDEIRRLNLIHRERTSDERSRMAKAEKAALELVSALDAEEIYMENLPQAVRAKLLRYIEARTSEPEKESR